MAQVVPYQVDALIEALPARLFSGANALERPSPDDVKRLLHRLKRLPERLAELPVAASALPGGGGERANGGRP